MSSFVNETVYNVVTSLQGDAAHCHWTVQECLERLAGQDGVQDGSIAQGGLLPWS